jgi:CubicO group peptidase (beta-lactamase class C family)
MRKSWSLIAMILWIATSGFAQNPTEVHVDKFVKAEMQRGKIPGVSLAVIKDGKPLIVKGYGFANLEHKIPVKPETFFQTASVGKQFTAMAVMLLVEAGKLELDQKVGKYLEVPESWKDITVRHLLTHTSTLPRRVEDMDERRDYTDAELWALIKKSGPTSRPGESFRYSNLGYLTLGFLINKVAGKSYYDFMQERVFKPLGMTTARTNSEADIVPNRAAGYRLVNGEVKNQEWVSPSMNSGPDGSFYFTIRDMVKWDAGLTGGKLLKRSSFDAMWTPVRLNDGTTHAYGFGWNVRELAGHRVIEHDGGYQGFASQISRYPDDNISVILFANIRDAHLGAMAHQIAEMLNPKLKAKDLEPAITVGHRRLLQQMTDGTPDRDLFTPEAAATIFPLFERFRDELRSFGAIENFELLNRKKEGSLHTNVYRVTFKNQKAMYIVTLKDGKITSMDLRPE